MRPTQPLVLGHRGEPRRGRENTFAAFMRALHAGADGVEFDVRRCADQLVVHHDATLRRGRRRRRLSKLAHADLPAWMPSLADVAEWAVRRDVLLDVELKEPGLEEEALDLLAPVLDRCVFTSFLPDVVHRLQELRPHARVGWISKSDPDAITIVAEILRPPLVVLPLKRCTLPLVQALQQLGCDVWAWKINDVRAADRLLGRGIRGFITDAPAALAAWRDAAAPQRTDPRKDHRESSAVRAEATARRTGRPRR